MGSSLDLSTLKGKSILVTGGASGLGLAAARSFAAAGAYVTIADIQSAADVGDKIAHELTDHGNHVRYAHCDVTDWASQVAAFKAAVMFAPHRTLDVVALFAGIGTDAGNLVDFVQEHEASLETDPAKPPSVRPIEINLTGLYYSSYLALHYFRLKPQAQTQEQAGHADGASEGLSTKSLIFVSSLAGYIDYPGHSLYNAAKFGVRGLFRGVRSRTKELGVRSNLLAPWFIKTPMTAPIIEQLEAQGMKVGQDVTFARIEDVVEATMRCAVDESVDGRAFAIAPEGIIDLNDDMEGAFAGPETRTILQKRSEAGDALIGEVRP